MSRGTLAAVAAAGLLCAVAGGCSDPKHDALDFNSRLNYAGDQLVDAAKEFSSHLPAALAGDKAEVVALRRSYQKMKQTLAKVRPDAEAVKAPPTHSARDFHAAVVTWLAKFDKRLDDYGAIVRAAEDSSLSPDERKEKVLSIARRLERGESADEAAVRSAQEAFAREHNFTLHER
jgi:hypothetical protein